MTSGVVGRGVVPLEFLPGQYRTLGLTGTKVCVVEGSEAAIAGDKLATVRADAKSFLERVRIDTPAEGDYYRHGRVLEYVLRQVARGCNRGRQHSWLPPPSVWPDGAAKPRPQSR